MVGLLPGGGGHFYAEYREVVSVCTAAGALHYLRRIKECSALNRAFAEWNEVFPNAACVVSLVDRLTHNAEIIGLEGKSYRHKEAQERAEQRAQRRRRKKP